MQRVAKFFRDSYLARFLIPVGLILIVVSIFVFIFVDNTKGYVKTEAVVSNMVLVEEEYTDIDGNFHDAVYTVTVKYTVNGTEYENELGDYSNLHVGDKITIAYNPSNPNDICQPSGIILPIILLVAGIASTIGGIVSIVVVVRKNKKLKLQEEEWSNAR